MCRWRLEGIVVERFQIGGRTRTGTATGRVGRRLLLGATALASACTVGGTSWAQVPEQTSNSGAGGSAGSQVQAPTADASTPTAPSTGVAEVVVTAQRRSERLQDVPIAVTAVTADDLLRNHIDNASRLEFVTPGFTFGSQGSDSFPAIRGVRTSLVSAQNDPVIGFYQDGVYQSRTQQQSIPLFDISRVEVQRGPQGTLYGRNTFGGNLSIVTNEPTKHFEAAVSAEGGNYSAVKAEGYINIPITDDLQVRIAAVHQSHDGYVHSTTPGVVLDDDDESAERISVKWTPTNRLSVLVHAGQWARDDAGAGSYGYKVAGTLINPATGYQSVNGVPMAVNPSVHNGTDLVHGVDIGVPVTGGAYTNDWDYQPFEHLVENFVSGTVSYDLGPAVLRSITGYTEFHAHRSADNDQSSVVFGDNGAGFGSGIQEPQTNDHTTSEEVQLASQGNTRFQWIVGGYYLHDDIFEIYQQEATAPGSDVDGYKETTSLHTDAYAGYAQASYSVLPDLLKVIGGIRYSKESKSFAFADYADAPPNTYDFTTPYSTSSGDPSFVRTTYRAGLEYTPTHNNMLYATFSTGFESGGVNDTGGAPGIPNSYAPQTVEAYEIGSKNRFLGGKVEANVSVYYNNFNNLQINVYTPQVSYFGSAGKAFSEGAEFEVKTLPLPDLHVDATATFQDAKYTFYDSTNNFYGASNGQDPISVSLAGKEIPQTPKVKTTLAIYYDYDLGRFGKLQPYLDTLFSTRYYTTDFNTSLDEQHAYAQLDLSLRWTDMSGKYYVEGYGNNVTDVPVLFSGVVGRAERIQVSYGPPAVYGVRVGAKF